MCPDETHKRFFHKSLSRDYHFCIDLTPGNLIILSLIDYVLICPIIPRDDFSFIIVHMIKDIMYLRGGSIIKPLLILFLKQYRNIWILHTLECSSLFKNAHKKIYKQTFYSSKYVLPPDFVHWGEHCLRITSYWGTKIYLSYNRFLL